MSVRTMRQTKAGTLAYTYIQANERYGQSERTNIEDTNTRTLVRTYAEMLPPAVAAWNTMVSASVTSECTFANNGRSRQGVRE